MNTRPISFTRVMVTMALLGVLGQTHAQQPSSPPTQEQIEAQKKAFLTAVENIGWTNTGVGKLGPHAEVAIPKGYMYTDGDGTRKLMQLTDNLPTKREQGMLASSDISTWIIFEWEDSGYVKDDDKDQLDPDATLASLKAGTEASNARRRELNMEELHVVGWVVPLRYNDLTKNLEWATRLRDSSGHESVNYNTRLLGRRGVMEVTLVCSPEEMQALLPEYQAIISTFHFNPGETYAEYRSGDKIAKYGLTGLVAAGAVAAASKAGLFNWVAKLGKGLIVILIAIAAGIKKLVSKMIGARGSDSQGQV